MNRHPALDRLRLLASCSALVCAAAPTLAQTASGSPAPAPSATAPASPSDPGPSSATATPPAASATGTTAAPVVDTPPPPPPVPVPPPPPANGPRAVAADTRYHDFLDTRLTWTFGDDDVLSQTGLRVPVSTLPRIGDRTQYQLFFDALNSRFAGRENLTHLVLYARAPGFIPRIQTEASLVLRFDIGQLTAPGASLQQALYDAGTFLRIQYQTNLSRPSDGISLTFFPFDTDRFRLGYLWDLSWGGNDVFTAQRTAASPGFKLALDLGPFSAFAGFKTTTITVPTQVLAPNGDIDTLRVDEAQYGALGGLGYRVNDMFRFDLGGGFFQQGRFDHAGVRGLPVWLAGGSARVVVSQGLSSPQSIDMMLYRNHPDFPMVIFAQDTYTPGRFSWLVSAEANVLVQNLEDIDRPGNTKRQLEVAAALQARFKYGYFSTTITGLYRDLGFIMRNQPGYNPYQAFSDSARTAPELFFAATADYRIRDANLLPSLTVGVQMPASFYTEEQIGTLQALRTTVIRRSSARSDLPYGQAAVPIFSMRAALRWDVSSIFAFVAWVQYVRDANWTFLQSDSTGTRQVRLFLNPDQLGFGLVAQARF